MNRKRRASSLRDDVIREIMERVGSAPAADRREAGIDDAPDEIHALFFACRFGWLEEARTLLDLVGNSFSDEEEGGALKRAITSGNLDLVRLMIERGASVRYREGEFPSAWWSMLAHAARHGTLDMVRMLVVEHGAREIDEAMGMAAFENRPEIVAFLVDEGADPCLEPPMGRRRWPEPLYRLYLERARPDRALRFALYRLDLDTALELLDRGCPIPAGSDSDILLQAVRAGDPEILERLLERGAAVHARGSEGLLAAARKRPELLPIFFRHGADPNRREGAARYLRPLFCDLCKEKEIPMESVRAFLSAGFDVRRVGPSLFGKAMENGRKDIVEALFAAGADPARSVQE